MLIALLMLLLLVVVGFGITAWQTKLRIKVESERNYLLGKLREERAQYHGRDVTAEMLLKSRTEQKLQVQDALRKAQEQLNGLRTLPLAPVWTSADNLNLRKFLDSESGVKLMQRALGMEYQHAARACADPMHTTHSAGRAAGFIDFRKWLESLASPDMLQKLSRSSGDQEETIQQADVNESVPAEHRSFD
jgi:hypothetical protein